MKRSIAGGVAAAALTATLIASPAHAEYYSIEDPADASASLSDMYGMRVRHGAEVVNVGVTFADLRRNSAAGLSVFVDTVRTRPGPEFVLSSGLGDGTDYALTKARRWQGYGEHIDCDYEARVKWGMDRFRTLISPDCFGSPEELRVSVKMGDVADASHPVTDWVPERRKWSLWLAAGGTAT